MSFSAGGETWSLMAQRSGERRVAWSRFSHTSLLQSRDFSRALITGSLIISFDHATVASINKMYMLSPALPGLASPHPLRYPPLTLSQDRQRQFPYSDLWTLEMLHHQRHGQVVSTRNATEFA